MKKRLTLIAAIFAAVVLSAQNPLPNDPEVKTGKLENGMTYYIRHNSLPQGRAEFYLATNVGAIQEAPDQDGLAHFLEHMCFNGLKNLPGKQMLEYLQHIGAEFGRNINASTGVEHTQYMLNNMPVTREGILDTCLLVMHDYSHFVLNDPKEIDAERGVILEEKRTRNTAGWRMFEKSAPYLYGPSSKYATCTVIGSEDNLKNFKPESLVNFYQTWYRPDMQALIVVGDIDVDQVYNKIVKLFADIPAPETPTVKVMPDVEINEEPVVGIITDSENTSTSLEFIWKLGEPTPKEMRGTDAGYFERLLYRVISSVMSERFDDIAAKSDAPFIGAGLAIDNICEKCEIIEGDVVAENAKILDACRAFLTEIEKMKRYGFTDDEIGRVRDDIIKSLKDRVAGESTRKNPEFIRPIISNFFDGTSYLAPQLELQLAQTILSQVNATLINQMLPKIFSGEHLTVIYAGVEKEGQVHPTKDQILAIVDEVRNADIKPNEAVAISSDFMEGRTVKAGKVKKAATGLYGSTVWTLKNGVTVTVLPTEYKKDQVIFSITRDGGNSLIPDADIASFDRNIFRVFNANSGIASFPATTVSKMLAGKTVNVSTSVTNISNGFNGSCTPEDIETALQIINLSYTAPRFDQEEWNVGINQIGAVLPNMISTPDYAFNVHLYKAIFGDSPRFAMINPEILAAANLETYAKNYNKVFGSVNGCNMYIVGNVDVETLKPLVEKYIGSIPKGGKASGFDAANVPVLTKGQIKDVFKTKMNTPKASVIQLYNAPVAYTLQKKVNLDMANFILDMIYTDTLREEEGGTYGASCMIDLSYKPREEAIIQVYFDTNIEQQEKLREIAIRELKKLAENGPTEEQLTRAVENARKNLPEKRITNNYWQKAFVYNTERKGGNYDKEYEEAIGNITADGIKAALSEILAADNCTEVVMLPED